MKRAFDLFLIVVSLPIILPVFTLTALLVRFKLGVPIFFCQQRPGLTGNLFEIIKFRSMTDARDELGNFSPDHVRMTKFGQFLRSTSLDELPELWNVVKGDMSLVGPRPLLIEYLPLYSQEQKRRHDVLPGVTGWAQVNGRNAISWEEKFKLDVWYVDNQSIYLDIRILLLTLKKVIVREGIAADGHVTIETFKGSVR
jgi:lipopolysaccharide/colanic/teichoic acid biosynthesis glycosyltransferase